MQLTRIETEVLKRLQKYHSTPPSLGERLRLLRGWMLLLLVPCIALAILLAHMGIPGVPFIPIGMYVGAIGREISNQHRFVKWWRINREITDWSRVEQLCAQEPIAVARAAASPTRKKWAVAIGLAGFGVIFGLFVVTDQALAYIYNPTRQNPPDSVIVLSASWCPYCARLRQHLVASNIEYTELDVDHTTEGNWAFYALRGTGIPITIVGSEVIRGAKWEKLDAALTKAGYKPMPVKSQLDRAEASSESSPLD